MINTPLKALRVNLVKSLLIFFTLFFSIVSIFLILSISNGLISMYSNILKSDGDIIITQKNISDTFFSNVKLDIVEKIEKFSGVKKVSALIVGASPIEQIPIVAVYGVSKNRVQNYKLQSGSYPKEGEVLIGSAIFERLKREDVVQIGDREFRVSGSFKSEIGFENGGIVLNLSDASKLFNKEASMVLVNCEVGVDIDKLLTKIESSFEKIDAKSTQSFVDNYNQFKIISISSNLISSISFFMGILTILSVMSITINERKNEFGIMRALGVPMSRVLFNTLFESFILSILAYVFALVSAYFILEFLKSLEQLQGYINGEIDLNIALYTFIATMLMAFLGAVIPSYKAAKIDPIVLIQER